jgi:hypothetical protein
MAVLGVPGFAPYQDIGTYFDYHHTPADTLDKIDPVNLRENCAVIALLAYGLANTDIVIPHRPQPVPEWLKGRLGSK